jgi:hypothetical protein
LCLRKTAITSTGLAHLENLTNLKWLNIEFTQVNDDGLVHLAQMQLKTLQLTSRN